VFSFRGRAARTLAEVIRMDRRDRLDRRIQGQISIVATISQVSPGVRVLSALSTSE
jgi:hypothetical protein